MRLFIAAIALVVLTGGVAIAEESIKPDAVRIVEDQKAKAFVFIIDEKPVALLDQGGLHVREAIEYGATLTDSGAEEFDDRIEALRKEAAHD